MSSWIPFRKDWLGDRPCRDESGIFYRCLTWYHNRRLALSKKVFKYAHKDPVMGAHIHSMQLMKSQCVAMEMKHGKPATLLQEVLCHRCEVLLLSSQKLHKLTDSADGTTRRSGMDA